MKTEQFIKIFEEYNTHTNLMSKNDVQKLREKHIPDSLAIKIYFEKYGFPKKLADIGTGGGFPSIPIALNYPKIDVFAIDSTAKKIKFIELVKKELFLENLYPVCTRIEDFGKKSEFDVVVTRALAELRVIAEYAAPFVKQGGFFVAYKSKGADEELLQAKEALKILGLTFVEKINYYLIENSERCLMIFKKIKNTPLIYPRKNNLVRKNPL